MSDERLTTQQKRLLERHHDGQAMSPPEQAEVRALLAGSVWAKAYAESLGEVGLAVKASEQVRWEEVSEKIPTGEQVAHRAEDDGGVQGAPLEDLWGVLQRYHDGEAIEAERLEVDALRQEREDVEAYLQGLEVLGHSVVMPAQAVADQVDFGGFWGAIEARLDEESGAEVVPSGRGQTREKPAFSAEDHQVMMYRVFDGEASEQEAAQVAAWAEVDPSLSEALGVLGELRLATQVAVEQAQQRADLSGLWAGVSAAIGQDAGVVSLQAHKARRGLWVEHKREIVAALAAMVCTVLGVGLFSDRIFGPSERVVIEKRVVILDSLEYSEGMSVVVTGAMQQASMELEEAQPAQGASVGADGEPEKAQPSPVIWLIEEGDEPAAGAEEQQENDTPSTDEPDAGRRGPI